MRRPATAIVIMLLVALSLAGWSWALHETTELERTLRRIAPETTVVIQPTPALLHDLDACHRRLDVIGDVIEIIEHRRGQEPPRTLQEQRAYRQMPPDRFVPGKGELSK